ncbi:ABC transporter permease [Bailinhaonella thermotolerans]|nr:ABC transporter permease [Bailinhaonella thermotolerans]
MGRVLLVIRLALRDLRRRRAETALLMLTIVAATTTLTLGLVLRDAAAEPYQSTRAATRGPDVVAVSGRPAGLERLAGVSGVTGHSGPYPVLAGRVEASGRAADVQIQGRDATIAAVDQPRVRHGRWIGEGGVVLEAAFAAWLKVGAGDTVSLNGRPFTVAGVAVTAASPPHPRASCVVAAGCVHGAVPAGRDLPATLLRDPGLAWLTRADVRALAPDPGSLSYVMNLKLAHPDQAQAFADRHGGPGSHGGPGGADGAVSLQTWQGILADATELARDSQILLMTGAWLLGLLAVAGLSVLVGGRLADQSRRIGLLKAVGATPGLVAAVLLAGYLLPAVVASAAGLVIGTLTAPLLTEPSAGLVGAAGAAPPGWSTVALVTAAALGVAAVAATVPAVRGARSSTVSALADAPRPPRRTGGLIAFSARLPVPLLLALRLAARRPGRAVLGVAGVAVTVSGLYVLLVLHAFLDGRPGAEAYTAAQAGVLRHVLLVWTVILLCLAAVNALVLTWAMVLDNRHASALARALGATPREMTLALAAAQVLPALAGAVLGVFPGGWALFTAITVVTGGDGGSAPLPGPGRLLVLVGATVLAVAALTTVPAGLGARRPLTTTL